ncbi:unnamed protein product, partial [Polarella glacialis]
MWRAGLSIDLGSTTLRAAASAWFGAEVKTHADLAIPAFIALTSAGKVLIGHEAQSVEQQSPGNVFRVGSLLRRLHEQRANDPEGLEPPPRVTVASVAGRPRDMLVAELLAMLFWRLREVAQERLGLDAVESLVLSVPALLGMVQRRTLEEAAVLAGFRRLRLLRSPLGAVLWKYLTPSTRSVCGAQVACGTGKKGKGAEERRSEGELQVLAIDVGSGHLSCTLVVIENGVFEVRWAGGRVVGGSDIDECLAKSCAARARRSRGEPGAGPLLLDSVQPAAWQRLLNACEKAKRSLTTAASGTVRVPVHKDVWSACGVGGERPSESVELPTASDVEE